MTEYRILFIFLPKTELLDELDSIQVYLNTYQLFVCLELAFWQNIEVIFGLTMYFRDYRMYCSFLFDDRQIVMGTCVYSFDTILLFEFRCRNQVSHLHTYKTDDEFI